MPTHTKKNTHTQVSSHRAICVTQRRQTMVLKSIVGSMEQPGCLVHSVGRRFFHPASSWSNRFGSTVKTCEELNTVHSGMCTHTHRESRSFVGTAYNSLKETQFSISGLKATLIGNNGMEGGSLISRDPSSRRQTASVTRGKALTLTTLYESFF